MSECSEIKQGSLIVSTGFLKKREQPQHYFTMIKEIYHLNIIASDVLTSKLKFQLTHLSLACLKILL